MTHVFHGNKCKASNNVCGYEVSDDDDELRKNSFELNQALVINMMQWFHKTNGVFFTTKKFAFYLKKFNFAFVS